MKFSHAVPNISSIFEFGQVSYEAGVREPAYIRRRI